MDMKHLESFESRGDINKRARILLDILAAKLLGGLTNKTNQKEIDDVNNEIEIAYNNINNSDIDWERDPIKSVKFKYEQLMKAVSDRYPNLLN